MHPDKEIANYDPQKLSENLLNAFIKYQNALNQIAANQESSITDLSMDPFNLHDVFIKVMQEMMTHPEKLWEHSIKLYGDYIQLWSNALNHSMGIQASENAPQIKDSRFNDNIWRDNPYFSFLKNSYYLNSSWVQNIIHQLNTLTPKESHKLEFYTKQFLDAMAPTNFPLTNPSVLKETLSSNGENLAKGAENFLQDVKRGKGKLSISTTNFDMFAVGENLAVTPGKVIYQNDLMQLIQYEPLSEKVRQIPLIMMPAWINKYYILDLQAQNSFVKWAVERGFTIFMVSWRNPDAVMKDKDFEDYMLEGPIEAIKVVKKVTGEKKVNMLGYCLGGTLLACTAAYLTAKKDDSINSATFLTSLTDFTDSGDLGVFIDEEQISALEKRMSDKGYLDGSQMAQTFSMLRANDMIWSFYVNNYLLGKEPFPFDILYWNSDSTRLPAKMHSYYLRNMYQNNSLVKPNTLVLNHVPIDLANVKVPAYMLSTREDHIAPWRATYKAVNLFSGPVHFVLSASGHVAGVVNHPSKNKYSYWVSDIKDKGPEIWLEHAKNIPGSWWVDWEIWLKKKSGELIAARKIDKKGVLEDAPGTYVKARL